MAILALATGAVVLILFLLLYLPLMNRLKIRGSECRSLEAEANQARTSLGTLKKAPPAKSLITEGEISLAIDELTKQGKSEGVNFISITPRQTEKSEDSKYRILPIDIEAESSYEALGRFLGSLELLREGLMTVGSFDVSPDSRKPSRIRTRLTVSLYLTA